MMKVNSGDKITGYARKQFSLDSLWEARTRYMYPESDRDRMTPQSIFHELLIEIAELILYEKTRFEFLDTKTPNRLAKFLSLNDDAEPRTFLQVTG